MAEWCVPRDPFTVERLYRNLLQLPRKYLEDEKLGVVIPVFAMVKESDDGSISDCVNLYGLFVTFIPAFNRSTLRTSTFSTI